VTPIWATSALVASLEEAASGFDVVGLKLPGGPARFPVNLPGESKQIAPYFGQSITLALLVPPADGSRSPEEELVWHRAEVVRLRELLAAVPADAAMVRVETGRSTMVITCRGEDAEPKVAAEAAAIMAAEDTRRHVEAAKRRATDAEANSERVSTVLRGAMLVIGEMIDAEKRGVVVCDGPLWDSIKEFAADPEVRQWLAAHDLKEEPAK